MLNIVAKYKQAALEFPMNYLSTENDLTIFRHPVTLYNVYVLSSQLTRFNVLDLQGAFSEYVILWIVIYFIQVA